MPPTERTESRAGVRSALLGAVRARFNGAQSDSLCSMATVLDLLLQRSMFLNGWEGGGTQIITEGSEPRCQDGRRANKRRPQLEPL